MTIALYLGSSSVKLQSSSMGNTMITRIHPEDCSGTEYDPYKDEKIVDLGPNDRMSVRQALTVAYNTELMDIVILGNCGCGCSLIKIITSSMTTESMLMLAEKLRMAIMDRELAIDESDGDYPKET